MPSIDSFPTNTKWTVKRLEEVLKCGNRNVETKMFSLRNRVKDDTRQWSIVEIYLRLFEEVEELREEIENIDFTSTDNLIEALERIIEEASDVAIFAFLLCDNCENKLNNS